jgi:hypothetical protein
MKRFKLITCIILVTVLTLGIIGLSLYYPHNKNIRVQSVPYFVPEVEEPTVEVTEPITEPEILPEPEVEETTPVVDNSKLVYEDSNIKITYTGYEVKEYGPVIYFNIKNISTTSLTLYCQEVYIDGCRVYISGMNCEKLQSGFDSTEEFVLSPKDPVDVYDVDKVTFTVKLVNPKSYLDLYQSDYITLNL